MSHHNKSFKCLFIGIPLVVLIASTALAGKPPKDDPPPAVPVEYQLTWVDGWDESIFSSEILDLNDCGVAVGFLRNLDGSNVAFRWTEQSQLQRLDELSTTWLDLNTNSLVGGWTASKAWDVNEAGQIVGTAIKVGEYTRTFVYQDSVGFKLLPTTSSAGTYWGASINEAGDVMGEHGINGSYLDTSLFFWSPQKPGTTTLLLPGYYWRSYSKMTDVFFPATLPNGNVPDLYLYDVDGAGTIAYQFDTDLQNFSLIGGASKTDWYRSVKTWLPRRERK